MKPLTSTSQRQRFFHQSSVAFFALASAFETQPFLGPDISPQDSKGLAARIKWAELMESLSRDRPNPSRVWNTYIELGSVIGFEEVPFQVQQQVLRKCVPRTAQLRIAAVRRMQAGNIPKEPHIYESRLQTLIGHMRASGVKPDLDDYNFILEQFAAVGHHIGVRLVFQELVHVGIEPSYKTYGLCLQAIAHRLTLPCFFRFRSDMLNEASRMCSELLDDMWKRRTPLTSVNFDLVHRIFKETSDRVTFEKLLRVGYGIDLAYPDCPPLEIQGPEILTGFGKTVESSNFKPLPFSTAALNTLIDMLGKTKQISRMVMAFEVYTAPITLSAPNSLRHMDDDDDEPSFFQFSSSNGATPFYQPPSAVPNTTTFNLLVRYAAKANHAVFARHYVVQAMEHDRAVDTQLRVDLSCKALKDIPSPNFAVNRGTFLPSFGLANRTRHFAFLRWSYAQTTMAWDQKKKDLVFYKQWRENHAITSNPETVDFDASDIPINTSVISPSLTPMPVPSSSAASYAPYIPELPEALQVDLDAIPPPPTVRKPLDLDLHISLLSRDVEEMGDLVRRMQDAVQRLSQRVKERLGRRIWQGKDIFIMSLNKRVLLGRREWTQRVGFVTPKRKLALNPEHRWPERRQPPYTHLPKRRRRSLPNGMLS